MVAKILLVAADAAICAGVKRVIERHCACSANVKCAASFAEAGKMLGGASFDMILADFEFEGAPAPGDQLAALRALAPSIPIVVLMGDDVEQAASLREGGVIEIIPKRRMHGFSGSAPLSDFFSDMAGQEARCLERALEDLTQGGAREGMVAVDRAGMITGMNRAAEAMTGWSAAEAHGSSVDDLMQLINPVTRRPEPHPLKLLLDMGDRVRFPMGYVLVRRDGSELEIEDDAVAMRDARGAPIGAVLIFRDASVKDDLGLHMDYCGKHDYLTGLPNRMMLADRVEQAIGLARRSGAQPALLFLDLDNFKHVNDSLGHGIGDLLLKSVAERLIGCVRASDTVCRQGGDEFVILLPDNRDAAQAALAADKILASIAVPHDIAGRQLYVSVSIGIGLGPADGADTETLLKSADVAMYQAKGAGRNNHQFFKQSMNDAAVERQLVESDLRHSLRLGQFILHYQPKVSLESGRITGVEALVRWMHPHWGMVMPARFIGVAEDFGLILPIGQWILREACLQAKRWQDGGMNAGVMAVNISALQFRAEGFVRELRELLASTGLDPGLLQLEITESFFMRDTDGCKRILDELKALGVTLAVDDFGTGYSSLSYLHRFPIDVLKIDRSFVDDIGRPGGNSALVAAVIAIGHSLGQRVVAEGVESQEQINFLKGLDCAEGQGYFYSEPVDARSFEQILARNGLAPFGLRH